MPGSLSGGEIVIALLLMSLVCVSGNRAMRDRDALPATRLLLFSWLVVLSWNWSLLARLPDIIRHDTILMLPATQAWMLFVLALAATVLSGWIAVLKTQHLQRGFVERPSFIAWLSGAAWAGSMPHHRRILVDLVVGTPVFLPVLSRYYPRAATAMGCQKSGPYTESGNGYRSGS